MSPRTLRWGIIATGGISKTFSLDLQLDRGTEDVNHAIVAVGSRSVDSAKKFIEDNKLGDNVVPGVHQDVYDNPEVDVVYIGSPHSHHYEHTKQALTAGKNVLCEKAFTVNAKQAKALVELAKEKGVFLMEAVWTRFFPIAAHFQQIIADGKIGKVTRVLSDLSVDFKTDEMDPSSRMIDPNLAGGALLDLGPYSLNFALLSLFPYPAPITMPTVKAQMTFGKTGVDLQTSAILKFPETDALVCIANSMKNRGPQCIVQGELGEIEWQGMPFRPTGLIVRTKDGKEETHSYPEPEKGAGMFHEADEVARCIFAGKKESERMSHASSVTIMSIFDAIRAEGGLVYPDSIEKM